MSKDLFQLVILSALLVALLWGSSYYFVRALGGDKRAARYAKWSKKLLRRGTRWVVTTPWRLLARLCR